MSVSAAVCPAVRIRSWAFHAASSWCFAPSARSRSASLSAWPTASSPLVPASETIRFASVWASSRMPFASWAAWSRSRAASSRALRRVRDPSSRAAATLEDDSSRAAARISAASSSAALTLSSAARSPSATRLRRRSSASTRNCSAACSAASRTDATCSAAVEAAGESLVTSVIVVSAGDDNLKSMVMAENRYNPAVIEPKWQGVWESERTWEVSNDHVRAGDGGELEKCYVLEMLPYPSGEPHVGHLKNYALGDAIAHFNRRIGRRVLHPMGYDAFGLPAENNAIKTGIPPREATERSIRAYRHWFHRWGISIDWSRELSTSEPSYYRWTQWLFLRLYERDLAYRKEAAVKWCPNDQTVLANEQVIDGRCERCGHEVEARQLEQWFFRITDYADRLLDDLELIDWPEYVKAMQRNWIGRSEGAEVTFRCEELGS